MGIGCKRKSLATENFETKVYMKVYLDCFPCFIRQALDACRMITDDTYVHQSVVRKVLEKLIQLDMTETPPAIAQHTHRLIKEITEQSDPYYQKKKEFNEVALGMYPKAKRIVKDSEDSIYTAVRLAIGGNIIDFGVSGVLEQKAVKEAIENSLTDEFDSSRLEDFKNAVEQAENILYLGDNAGEIVFDKLLIEFLPYNKITFAVRGEPIINDITFDDAREVGLTEMVKVIDNGSDAPGTILDDCSDEFLEYFRKSDLVIAKGQGNYETLSGVDKDIFFILKAKCPMISHHIGCPVGEMILHRNKIEQQV
jgi:hypothetical protein